MEVLALIFILWLIGCAFPGSSGGGADIGEGIALLLAFIASAAVVLAVMAALMSAAAFIVLWLGDVRMFPFVLMGLIGSAMLVGPAIDFCRMKRSA